MTKEELEKATGQELIEQRDYCGRDNYYYEYLENVNAEMLKRFNRLAELEAEVKEWKDKADLWCKTANFKDHNIMINKDLEKENAELKSENQKWKDEWQEQVQKATDEGYARTLQTMQLTKAKEHIRTLISCLIDWVQEGDKDYCHITDAEQFLNSEVINALS